MDTIENLYPENIWKHFSAFCSIPHPSDHEAEIVAYIGQCAEEAGLEYSTDKIGNILVKKPASPSCEQWPVVALQAHVDMVPQKNSNIQHDFVTDPIKPYIDGEWVTAENTTLGADNGVGAATMLALLEASDVKHGPIEALFTVQEENGMGGAFGLEQDVLKAQYLINTDSEEEKDIIVGCAGGVDVNITAPLEKTKAPTDGLAVAVAFSGMKGGHSGVDIHLHRANANIIAAQFALAVIEKLDAAIIKINGGNMRNAIPRESFVAFYIDQENQKECRDFVFAFEAKLNKQFEGIEDKIATTFSVYDAEKLVLDTDSTKQFLTALLDCPNGDLAYVDGMDNTVESSNNISIVRTQENKFEVNCLQRSSSDENRLKWGKEIESVFSGINAETVFENEYPGWKPVLDSELLHTAKQAYEKAFNRKPAVKVIHAGLECGIIGSKYPKMEMVSVGPTIKYPHSPDEKVHIDSVGKYWDYVCLLLAELDK